MKEYTGEPELADGTELHGDEEFYFKTYCDVCGRKDNEENVRVRKLTEKEGYPDGDYCEECRTQLEEEGLVGDDLTLRTPEEGSQQEQRVKLDNAVKTARIRARDRDLGLEGFWTYDNEYFSPGFISWLVDEEFIHLNEDIGETPTLDLRDMELDDAELEARKSQAIHEVLPWYHLDRGKLFDKGPGGKARMHRILQRYERTMRILNQNLDDGYMIHADNAGPYLLELMSLSGGEHNEVCFSLDDMSKLREFIEEKKPKGAVLTFVTADNQCRANDVDLGPLMELFDIPEMRYLKLLFVTDSQGLAHAQEHNEGKGDVHFILAYTV